MIELYVLIGIMIVGAIIAIEVRDLLSAVIAVGAVGLALSITFLILKAPDVAITQLVVELLALIILIRATLKRDILFSTTGRWVLNTLIIIGFMFMFSSVAIKCFKDLPAFGHPIMKVGKIYLADAMARTGATNVVSAVILDFRAYDTLGEATILFTAVTGVLAVLRRKGRKKPDEEIQEEGYSE